MTYVTSRVIRLIARVPPVPPEVAGVAALRQLRSGVQPVLDAHSERERRQRIAGRVVELAEQLARQRARRQRAGLALSVAALVGACALGLNLHSDARTVTALDTIPSAELRHPAAAVAPLAAKVELPSSVEPAPESSVPLGHSARARWRVPATSELGAQNRLLEAAERAQKVGMTSLALQRLQLLIERYPDAELAHNARVERFRVLRSAGRGEEAIEAARAYLERHPSGFARSEAEHLIQSLSARIER